MLQTELRALDAEATQRAKGLEAVIDRNTYQELPLAEILAQPLVQEFWTHTGPTADHRLYSAIVDPHGTIVLHGDKGKIGRQLDRGWYDSRLPEYGNVTYSSKSVLNGNGPVYDVSKPVKFDGAKGEYHAGIDAAWLDRKIAAAQRLVLVRWSAAFAIVLFVVVAGGWSLARLARFFRHNDLALAAGSKKRAYELSQIGSGLAHEVRNPLHALRINLHTLRRALGGRSALPPDQLVATVDESDAAIDRLDELMRDFLQYSDPTAGTATQVDLVHETEATLRLLAEDFRRDQIRVERQLPSEPAQVDIDPQRLRQVLLNLLTFAQHRAGKSGVIRVSVERQNAGVELRVGDSGPLLPEKQREKLFEPFQAPAETGSGLGLALVQAFVEEAGGRATCNGEGSEKGRCRLWFPLDRAAVQGVPS